MTVFTTPVSSVLFQMLIEKGRYPDYCRWLKDLVNVFGNVYHFMDINSITREPANFQDENHLNSQVAGTMFDLIINGPKDRSPSDFGIILNNENIQDYLDDLRKEIDQMDFPDLGVYRKVKVP
jgi:hypothetical protein